MHLLRCLLLSLVFIWAVVPVMADDALTVKAIVDADTLTLSNDTTVRLYGIQAPQPAQENQKAWPLFGKAKDHLEDIALKEVVTLRSAPVPANRFGQHLAEVILEDGKSLQVAMLEAGMARVYTTAENPAIATALYPVEEKARSAKLGIWALPAYAVQTPETVGQHLDRFQIVEGTVASTATIGGVTYLNFGADWRTDFTIAMNNTIASSIGAADLKGHKLRARGWVHEKNGPMLKVTHVQQIEFLNSPDAQPAE